MQYGRSARFTMTEREGPAVAAAQAVPANNIVKNKQRFTERKVV